MPLYSFLKRILNDFIRFYYKGARVDAALQWAGRTRLNAGEVYVKPGATPVEFDGHRMAYNADDIVRKWIVTTKGILLVKNNSSVPAYNIQFLNGAELFDQFEFRDKLASLGPNESREIRVEFTQITYAVSGLDADKLPKIPPDKENKWLRIKYENERGTKLFTNFLVSFDITTNEYTY